jgi:hypothetical protein
MKYCVIISLAVFLFSSCGPTAREKEVIEQAREDSMKAYEDMKRNAEEIATQQAAAQDTLKADTTVVTDSLK